MSSQTFSVSCEQRIGIARGMLPEPDEATYVIRVDPLETPQPGGGSSIRMGFPVLVVTGWVAEPEAFAKRVAELLQEAQP